MSNKVKQSLDLRAALRNAGQRYSKQREAIYLTLLSSGTHPTADDIYIMVRDRIPHVSLATVYKALESLVAAGLAAQVPGVTGPTRYDHSPVPHIHLRNLADGMLYDLPPEIERGALADLGAKLAGQLRSQMGFKMTGMSLEILGEFSGKTR